MKKYIVFALAAMFVLAGCSKSETQNPKIPVTVTWSGVKGVVTSVTLVDAAGASYKTAIDANGDGRVKKNPAVVASATITIAGNVKSFTIAEGQFSYDSATSTFDVNGNSVATAAKPYLVATAADLIYIRTNLSKHYLQVRDIDLAGRSDWMPIGSFMDRFLGSYDGGGYMIDNMTVGSPSTEFAGLFGVAEGSLKNITIGPGCSVAGYGYIGGVCGLYSGTSAISGCLNYGTVTGSSSGGVVGMCTNDGGNHIFGCYNAGTITSTVCAGGICGICANVRIEGCANVGNISTSGSSAGGIVGSSVSSFIYGCYNNGDVHADISEAGGICGYLNGIGSMSGCYNTGKVTCNGFSVCYIASNTASTIDYCYWKEVPGSDAAAGSNHEIANGGVFADCCWPAADAAHGWGVFSSVVTGGYYWKSLGGWNTGGATTVYPKLWWEN